MAPTSSPCPLPSASTSDGWVTLYRTHVPGIGQVLIQKRDGCTRSVTIGR